MFPRLSAGDFQINAINAANTFLYMCEQWIASSDKTSDGRVLIVRSLIVKTANAFWPVDPAELDTLYRTQKSIQVAERLSAWIGTVASFDYHLTKDLISARNFMRNVSNTSFDVVVTR